jgi:uncharacterized protein with NAD-binding domain and iron-sulfur cluster
MRRFSFFDLPPDVLAENLETVAGTRQAFSESVASAREVALMRPPLEGWRLLGERPIEVAIIGGGCASIATAFELTRPEHNGKYHVTVYQQGWRLGGKGASGRGPAGRIEEHGLHVWLGSYDNAFRLLRECYAELDRDARHERFADWRDAFFPDSHVGMADRRRNGDWVTWTAYFPPAKGLPGDPIDRENPFTIRSYLARAAALLRALLFGIETRQSLRPYSNGEQPNDAGFGAPLAQQSPEALGRAITAFLRVGALTGAAALVEAIALIEAALRWLPENTESTISRLLGIVTSPLRDYLEQRVETDDQIRCKWEIIDVVLAVLVGVARFRLISDPRGFDAINEYDGREWLRLNGASERSLNSAFMRGLYDMALAYAGGDPQRPQMAAGQALRGSLRLFFSYRGALFWKMRAGMGDVVFAPFYQVLAKRGVTFEFFHRLENVKLADPATLASGERLYVEALNFDVQAEIRGGGPYRPLTEVNGTLCWPADPDWQQLEYGERLKAEHSDFESHWDRRKVGTKTLHVTRDFDFVVLGVSIGAIPHVCREIVARDARWRAMIANVKTVATQAFQIWLNEDIQELGWEAPPVTLAGFTKPFDTWADMGQVIPAEAWREPPRTVAYFCNVLADPMPGADAADPAYLATRREEVRHNAISFLSNHIRHLWPKSVAATGGFRWELLVDPHEEDRPGTQRRSGEERFASQFWTANVNPSDRYVLALPGTLKYRISPLDNTYDNLTIAGDWTDCGFNGGCVEAAMMSGRLAAHALSQSPALEEIVAYDHP